MKMLAILSAIVGVLLAINGDLNMAIGCGSFWSGLVGISVYNIKKDEKKSKK